MFKVFTKREKIILHLTICVIVFAISFNTFVNPVLTKNDTLNKEINITRTKLSKYLRLLSQKENIQSKYSSITSSVGIFSQQTDKSVNALAELENLAKRANIRIIDLRPQTTKSLALYKELPIDLRTEGTMENYLRFIYDMENSLLLLRIKRMQLNALPNTQTLEGNFSIAQLSID